VPKVRVRRIERDYGPATKLIPSVMEAQAPVGKGGLGGEDVLVLVVDDDTLCVAIKRATARPVGFCCASKQRCFNGVRSCSARAVLRGALPCALFSSPESC